MQNNLFTKSSFRNVILVLLFLALFTDCSFGQLVQTARMTPQGVGYLEYLPPDYSTNTTRTYPVLIFLHGTGEMGSGTPADLEKVKANGPPKLIKNGSTMCFNVNGTNECFIVISPQLSPSVGGWWPSYLQPFFNEILNGISNYRIDKTRVYLTGLSLGGEGVYLGIGGTTDVFAAAAVIAGFDNGYGCTISARKIPVWGFHGTSDTTIPYTTGVTQFNAIVNCTSPVPTAELKWTSYPNVGHNAWDNAYTTDHSVQSPLNLYEWLLTKKKAPVANQLPVVNAGTNKTIVVPTSSTTLTGSATDVDGTISSYQWTQVSGPNTATLANSTSATVSLSNLVVGVYTMKLTATDNSGGVGSSTVTVTLSTAPPAGSNLALFKTVTTSSTEAYLGSQSVGSNAVDGNLATRWSSAVADPQWIQVDLGASYSLNRVQITWETACASNYEIQYSSDAANWSTLKAVTGNTVLINNYTGLSGTGRYIRVYGTKRFTTYGYSIYELEVYGTSGGNNTPVVNAGTDKKILPPASTLTVTGTATDSDGIIASVAWTKVSGPSAVLSNANTLTLSLSSLVPGTYVFRLTATDNAGATSSDDVNVVVNTVPVANAGADKVVQLPTNSITLTGTATDTDGTIASYVWAKISGPAATLTNASTASLSLSALVAGSYIFRLTATDNSGSTGSDDVNVTVNPAPVAAPPPPPSAGTNIALQKPVTTSSDQAWLGAQGVGSNAVDGSLSTRWSSEFTPTEWIAVDLGSNYSISKIKIFWEASLAVSYRIDYSPDGITWTTIKTVTGNSSANNELTDITGTTRYVRIVGLVRSVGWGGVQYGYSIYELEVYGTFSSSSSSARTASTETTLTASATESVSDLQVSDVEEKASLTFLDKTYTGGKQYDVAIFNTSGSLIYTGKWSSEIHTEVLKPNGFYFYHIIQDGKRIDAGKVVTTDQ